MSNLQKTKVEIDGMTFTVVGNEKEEYIKDLADDLNKRIKTTLNSNFRLNENQAIILTALNILDEREKLDKKYSELSSISENLDTAKESLEKVESLESKSIEESKKAQKYKELYEETLSDLNYYKESNEKLRLNNSDYNDEIKETKTQIDDLEKIIEELKEKNYNDQLKIIDLSKEISILKNEDEDNE